MQALCTKDREDAESVAVYVVTERDFVQLEAKCGRRMEWPFADSAEQVKAQHKHMPIAAALRKNMSHLDLC